MKRTFALALIGIPIIRASWAESLYLPLSPLLTPTVKDASQIAQYKPMSTQLERRDQPETNKDLRILLRANELLKDESMWNRNDDRIFDDDEATGKRSLFCALQKAPIEVLGTYNHHHFALQEIRLAVDEASVGRYFRHRIRDLNNRKRSLLTSRECFKSP